jgi:hypothetical protein
MQGYILPSNLLKTAVSDGTLYHSMDTLLFFRKLWLVPHWLNSEDERWRSPERIVALENFTFEDLRGRNCSTHFAIREQVPVWLLDGPTNKQKHRFLIVERPELQLPN